MSDVLLRPAPRTEAECEALVAQLFREMEQLNEQMRGDQADIERLTAESDRLQIEGRKLDAEARDRLKHLHEALDELRGRNESAHWKRF